MKSKVKKLDGTANRIDIVLPSEMVNKMLEEVLKEIKKTAKIPGFRPGKAPIDMVFKEHKNTVWDEVKRRLVPIAYQRALDEHNISPVSYPEVSDLVLDEKGSLSFKATVDLYPEIKAKKYKGLKVTSEKIKVEDREVDETIERVQNMHAEFIHIDHPVKKKEFAICDVEAFVDGKSISKKRENMWIEAVKESSLLGLGEELCGMNKGEKKDIEVTLPENYPDKKFAGKKAMFKVEIKEVKEKKLPEVDDELAKKAGKDDMKTLKEEIKSQLLERKTINNDVNMKNQILEQLLKGHKFAVPVTMVKKQLQVLMEKAENELATKGVSKDIIDSQKDSLKEKLLPEAENKVSIYFILDEIAKQEEVTISDEEVDRWLEEQAKAYSQPFENVKKYYTENDLIGGLKEQLREDKTLELLLQEATITTK